MIDERGWAGASAASVGREAGLTTGALYDEFRSLEHCYVAVYDETIERLAQLVQRALATRTPATGEASWEDQLEIVFSTVLWFFALEPALARACLVEVVYAGPAARSRREQALSRFSQYVETLRLAHGEPMPALAAEVIALGTADLIQRRVARGEAERLPELLPELSRLWDATAGAHPEPVDRPALAVG